MKNFISLNVQDMLKTNLNAKLSISIDTETLNIFKEHRLPNPLTKRDFNLHYKVVTGLVV